MCYYAQDALNKSSRQCATGKPSMVANGMTGAPIYSMATSADILGSVKRMKVPARWAEHYERLCAERDKLMQRDCSQGEAFQPKLDDMADAASEESQRGLTMVTATARQGAMAEVLDALRRIERGTYGMCEITGEPIPAERLISIPWARYSLAGQQQLEQSGMARRVALPALEGLSTAEAGDTEEEDAD
jgi:RNA polymerase-binding transcription factor DksA